ncbi:hypothetical protein N7453_006377 [Penicillium expansum]|nr:hypothetical protein N7453_006377 [Penicillium expansum]
MLFLLVHRHNIEYRKLWRLRCRMRGWLTTNLLRRNLSSSVENCGSCDGPTFTDASVSTSALELNPPAVLVAPVKYQAAAQAPALISLMIPKTVVLAMRSPVLDSKLAAVRVVVLISRPQLPIAARVVIRVVKIRQIAALGLART